MEANIKFNEKLVELRKEEDWSQLEFGERVGVHIAFLSRLENGKSQLSLIGLGTPRRVTKLT